MRNRSPKPSPPPTTPGAELRRDVGVWGSFMWGYSDVGADIYVALGLVMAYAQGAASLVFALAGSVYIMIGLAYTELASAYPVAGGGPYFTLRGLGDFWGFVGGSALLLDYTIDIALFATASAGYLNFFLPQLIGRSIQSFAVTLGPFHNVNPVWCLETLLLIAILILLNIRGVRESTFLQSFIGIVDLLAEGSIIIFGFLFAWKPELLALQWKTQFPSFHNLVYGSSLAIISFVGLESISQAAQETKRPATVIPRTSLTLIFTVFIFAVSFSTLGLGVFPWQVFRDHMGDPVAYLAHGIPFIGFIAGPFAAILGGTILFISANSGIFGASRLTYSLAQFGSLSPWFCSVHPKFHTPVRTIVIFSMIGVVQTILAFLTPSAMDTLGNMYAFGAATGYTLVFIALIKLRFSDPYTPRPYRVPLNFKLRYKGRRVDFPVLGVIGTLGIATILFEVVLTHAIGRIAGPAWVLLCFVYYAWYRKKAGFPVFRSIRHDWEREQIDVLTSAEEFDLLEQYKNALKEKRKEPLHVPAD